MENKNKILLVVGALFSIVILLAQNNVPMALAITTVNLTVSGNNVTFYEPTSDVFYIMSGSGSPSATQTLQKINAQTGALLATYTIKGLTGNVSAPTQVNSGLNGSVHEMWCNSSACFWIWDTGTITQVQKWLTSTGSPASYLNYTGSNLLNTGAITGISASSALESLGQLYVVRSVGTSRVLQIIGTGCASCSPVVPLQVVNTKTLSATSVAIGQIAGCYNCGGTATLPVTGRIAISYQNSGGGFVIDVLNFNDNSILCTSSLSSTATTNSGALMYAGNTIDKWVISDNSAQVKFLNRDTCAVTDTITSTQLGSATNIRGLGVNTVKHEYYVYSGSSSTQAYVSIMNLSSITSKIQQLYSVGSSMPRFQAMAIGTSRHQVLLTDSGTVGTLYLIDGAGTSSGSGGGGISAFCQIPANFNILQCFNERNGNNSLHGTSQLLNQSSTNIMCQVGLVHCTQGSDGNFTPDNADMRTNGVGYLLTAVIFAVVIGIFWVASRGQLMAIPTFIWFITAFGILAFATIAKLIDPTFLVLGMVIVVAFAVAKARGVLGGNGGQMFDGEMG